MSGEYQYYPGIARSRIQDLREAYPGLKIKYSLKANSFPRFLDGFLPTVDSVDVSSERELSVAKSLYPGIPVSISGPGKDVDLLDYCAYRKALVNIECLDEARELSSIAETRHTDIEVAIRVNPNFKVRGAGFTMGGKASPFGIDLQQVYQVVKFIKESPLRFRGFQVYAGTQILDSELVGLVQRYSAELLFELQSQYGGDHLSFGGGLGVPYHGEEPVDLQIASSWYRDLYDKHPEHTDFLSMEVGRYIVAPAGEYRVTVLYKKESYGKNYLVVDGGIHENFVISGGFGQLIPRNFPVWNWKPKLCTRDTEVYDIVGKLCTPQDVLARGVVLPVTEPGDTLVFDMCGAYCASASMKDFLSHEHATEGVW